MRGINLESALRKERHKLSLENEKQVLHAFTKMLAQSKSSRLEILNSMFGADGGMNQLDDTLLDPTKIYHLKEIKQICIDYRLRFLDASRFKGAIPNEALDKIEALQNVHETTLNGYKIIAPANMFKLEERDKDPLLFANLGNGYYYLIHKWGKDLAWYRRALVYPFRDFESLFKTMVGLCLVIAMSVPSELMMGPLDKTSFKIRVIFFFYLFFAFAGLTALYGFSRVQNFNKNLWNSKYFS